jgi:hypothetical protein
MQIWSIECTIQKFVKYYIHVGIKKYRYINYEILPDMIVLTLSTLAPEVLATPLNSHKLVYV